MNGNHPKSSIRAICPSCGFDGSREPLPYGGYHYAGRDMPLIRCPACRLMFVAHGLSKEEIGAFYDEERYFDSEYAGGAAKKYEANREELEKKADFALKRMSRFVYGGSLLEVGCAGGYFLASARDRYGFIPKGIDLSKLMRDFGREKLGLDIHCGTIHTAPSDWTDFDAVYMGDVLEHVPDPVDFAREISSRMKPGGILCLEIPLSYNGTLSGAFIGLANMFRGRFGRIYFLPSQLRANYANKPPYHLLMFDKSSMERFLTENGFEVVHMKIYEGKPKDRFGGSLYAKLKAICHYLTLYLPQNALGDRMIAVARNTISHA